ncbi:MAG: LptF/LptG family permease [Phycisphaeraceae bacterium]
MKLLDRYIARSFLLNFVILTVVLLSLIFMVDMVVDLDEFTQAAAARQARFWDSYTFSLLYAVVDYYYPQTFLLYTFLSGVLVVGAMGFTLAALTRTRELVAMVTCGVSMYRIAAPVLIIGGLLNALAIPLQEFVIPPLASKLARGKSQVKLDVVETFRISYAPDGRGNLLSAAALDPEKRELQQTVILERSEQGQVLRRIEAQRAAWDADAGGWMLHDVRLLEPTGPTLGHTQVQGVANMLFVTALSPDVLLARRAAIYTRLLSMRELITMSQSAAADTNAIRRLMQARFSAVVVSILLLVIALPFFLTREPVNLMVQGVYAAGTCLAAWAASLVVLQVGVGSNPVFAAWLPAVLLFPLAMWLFWGIKT